MRPAYTMSGSEALSALDALHIEAATRDTYRLELLARLEETGYAKELGARDTTRLLSMRHRLDAGTVRRDLKLATNLAKYQAVTAALPDPHTPTIHAAPTAAPDTNDLAHLDTGPDDTRPHLHPAQAEAIVSALESVRKSAMIAVEDLQTAEDQMVKAAEFLSPLDLGKLGRQVRDRLDTDGPEPAEDQAYRRESLWLHNADHGIKFGGFLANENAEALKTAIHALAKPHKTVTGELDPRSRDKRQADALTTLITLAANANDADSGHRSIAMTVTIDYADLKSRLTTESADGIAVAEGVGGDVGAGSTGDGFGELVYGDNLSAAAVRRLACDAGIIPIVLGSRSEPLDVGAEQRFVTRPIRRALNRRDKGCVVCGAPPIQCEAHHLIHRADGGPTAVTNLVLLCKAHHTDLHKGHWTITITNGTVHVARPSWAEPTRRHLRRRPTPRGPTAGHPSPDGPSVDGSVADGSVADRPLPIPQPPPNRTGPTPGPIPDHVASPSPPATRRDERRPVPALGRAWPMDRDIPWITPAEAALLSPWEDTASPRAG
ncbi:HNH endonuclease [Kribbella orskensis]|uniref:HNH endonuclease n=2 Tax=Kribbellaceae TaxID=2726069 RepID=A0ABY2BQY8_9ACTN|nr:HNH endonuclease [Kribbella sp. VKM Ac-2500]TCO27860.1 HNH endonuclease [Kribbella orskensis]